MISAQTIRDRIEASLANMRTDVVDLYYFHHCDFGPDDRWFDDAFALVRRFREEGKIRFIGLSDWDASRIMKFIARVDPDVVQPYRNLLNDDYESSGLQRWVDAHDLGVAFFSPLKHGLLLGKYDAPQTFGEGDFRSGVADFGDPEIIERSSAPPPQCASASPAIPSRSSTPSPAPSSPATPPPRCSSASETRGRWRRRARSARRCRRRRRRGCGGPTEVASWCERQSSSSNGNCWPQSNRTATGSRRSLTKPAVIGATRIRSTVSIIKAGRCTASSARRSRLSQRYERSSLTCH